MGEQLLCRAVGVASPWESMMRGPWSAHWRGREDVALTILERIDGQEIPDDDTLSAWLGSANTPFAFILTGPDGTIAAVDQNRSYPIFHGQRDGVLSIGGDAHEVADTVGANSLRPESILEAATAGYVTGPNTLRKDLHQLEAGSFLICRTGSREPTVKRYFRYWPTEINRSSEPELRFELGAVLDSAFRRTMEQANGRPIWVPLSGGLDSRLVATKLKELGYPDIQTFTYGLPDSNEVRVAQKVADALDLPWRFIRMKRAEMPKVFASDRRKAYYRFAGTLASIPNPQEFHVLYKLMNDGILDQDVLLVNGQSGDFITGAHIPKTIRTMSRGVPDLMDWIISKHFDNWRSPRNGVGLGVLRKILRASLQPEGGEDAVGAEMLATLAERWEHQERQAKFTINQQRCYEFFDLDWALPLWDMELVNFFRGVPLEQKINQRLYKAYLQQWNYNNLFSSLPAAVSAWGPTISWAVIPVSSLLHHIVPKQYHRALGKVFYYMDNRGHHYSTFGMGTTLKYAGDFKNAGSLYIRQWLEEQGIDFDAIPEMFDDHDLL
ncbi:MAG: hypothetical protein HQ501_07360 [Rhodospirillales bacterium]|nr:hypothetical protein [Rhodospirillales bacterium]